LIDHLQLKLMSINTYSFQGRCPRTAACTGRYTGGSDGDWALRSVWSRNSHVRRTAGLSSCQTVQSGMSHRA